MDEPLIVKRKPITNMRLRRFVIRQMRRERWQTFNPFAEDDSGESVCFIKDGVIKPIDVVVEDFDKFIQGAKVEDAK